MFGDYARAGIYAVAFAVVTSLFVEVAEVFLGVADCTIPPGGTAMCTQGQHVITYFPLAGALSIFILLFFRAWVENRTPGL